MGTEKAVVLSSGGLNSAVVTAIAGQDHSLALLHARFDHRAAEREAELFEKQADHFSADERLVVDLPYFAAIGGSARVSRKRTIEDAMAIGEGPSSCHVPGLIGTLAHAAFSWAAAMGASKVFIGVSENLGPPAPKTFLIYPDYSREYLLLLGHQFSVASAHQPITLESPLADLTRTEIVKLGRRLKAPFELTWSCLSSATQACGSCVGCATRARGFLNAAMPDPIVAKASVPESPPALSTR